MTPPRGLGEGFRCLRRAVAASGNERVAIGDVQLCQSLPLRFSGFHLVRLRHRREQRLRLSDLGHFRRGCEALERRREDGVGFGGAAGRLIEPGEREGSAQFEASCSLLLRDGDGGAERFLRRRWVGGIVLQQHSPANAMQLSFERPMSGPLACR